MKERRKQRGRYIVSARYWKRDSTRIIWWPRRCFRCKLKLGQLLEEKQKVIAVQSRKFKMAIVGAEQWRRSATEDCSVANDVIIISWRQSIRASNSQFTWKGNFMLWLYRRSLRLREILQVYQYRRVSYCITLRLPFRKKPETCEVLLQMLAMILVLGI